MIIFGTDKSYKFVSDDLRIASFDAALALFKENINKKVDFTNDIILGLDSETSGLDPYINTTLLLTVGTPKVRFVFDVTNPANKLKVGKVLDDFNSHILFIGQNLKFDNNFMIVHHGMKMRKMWDIMIGHQRIYQNMGYRNDLVNIIKYYTGIEVQDIDKTIRQQFIGAKPDRHIFTEKQVRYAANDIKYIEPVMIAQKQLVKKYGYEFLLSDELEMGLINVLSEMELEGLCVNKEQMKKLIAENEDKRFKLECDMDEMLRKLRDDLLVEPETRMTMVGGPYDQPRNRHPRIVSQDLFGGEVSYVDMQRTKGKRAKKVKVNTQNINYSSPTQMIRIFANLNVPMPTKFGRYIVPFFADKKNKQGTIVYYIANKNEQFTTKKEYLEQFAIKFKEHPMTPFVKLLVDYRKVTKRLDSFGEQFIKEFINPVTGKLHTVFRQCAEVREDGKDGKSPINGRLSSGHADENKPNMQNIPREKEYRTAFHTDPGYSIITCDLAGAEVTVMADKGADDKLLKYVNDGTFHDFVATNAWRQIYANRAGKEFDILENYRELNQHPPEKVMLSWKDNQKNAKTFIVDKHNNPDLRQYGKNMHFGTFYNMGKKKAGETLNIEPDEGQIYINYIRKAFPKTFKTLGEFAAFAIENGYLVIDTRTNARIWFPDVLKVIRHNRQAIEHNKTAKRDDLMHYTELEFMDRIDIEGAARNISISGTQANLVKESMVVLWNHKEKNKLDVKMLLQVHDELVMKCPKNMDGQSEEWEDSPVYVTFKPDKPFSLRNEELLEYYAVDKYKDIEVYKDTIVSWKVDYPRFVSLNMCEVSNRYLKTFKMRADYHVADTWIK